VTMPAKALLAALAAALVALGLASCDEEEEPVASVTRGLSPPSGDLISTATTILPEQGYSTLATTIARSRGGEALIVATVLTKTAASGVDFRLTINGEPARETRTQTFGSVVAVYCACQLKVGESDIELEASAPGGARVGARSLIAYTPAALEDIESEEVISTAAIEDQTVDVESRGTRLITTSSGALGAEAEKLILLASYRSAAESSASPDVIRVEGLLDGREMDEVGAATFPGGKLAVFFSPRGADAGARVELRGFVTAGQAPVNVSTLAVCPCDLEQ
jgi:hypothetical protein